MVARSACAKAAGGGAGVMAEGSGAARGPRLRADPRESPVLAAAAALLLLLLLPAPPQKEAPLVRAGAAPGARAAGQATSTRVPAASHSTSRGLASPTGSCS